jgi:teichuronic acid biosynthesis glycosyltransferase TuaG
MTSLVSIIMPCYKMGAFVGEALASISAQTHRNWELIVVDDCGPEDGTRSIISEFAASHPEQRVELITHEQNRGVCAARKTAMAAAGGEYLAFLDPDDAFNPGKIEKQLQILMADPAVVLVHTAVTGLGKTPEGVPPAEKWFSADALPGAYFLHEQDRFLIWNNICTSTVMCRSEAVNLDDIPDSMVFQYEDYFLWCLLCRHGRFFQMEEPLSRYRIHEGSYVHSQGQRAGKEELAGAEFLLRIFDLLPDWRSRKRAASQLWWKLAKLRSNKGRRVAFPKNIEFIMVLVLLRRCIRFLV